MKFEVVPVVIVVVSSLIFVSLAAASAIDDVHWQLYKRQHGKSYNDPQEDLARQARFLMSKQQVERHNAHYMGDKLYRLQLNHMSDWTEEELATLNGFKMTDEQYKKMYAEIRVTVDHPTLGHLWPRSSGEVPAEVDWRKVPGRVSSVKDQGQCGSCWAFATTGVLEGQQKGASNQTGFLGDKLVPLSEQNLVDCSRQNWGCRGGSMSLALQDIAKGQGIENETDYPYEAQTKECRYKKEKSAMTDTGYALLPANELDLEKAVAKFGPIAAAIEVKPILFQYKSGVYVDYNCLPYCNKLNHAVLVVGYGTDEIMGDYWLIKNSWGEKWGEQGYFRMARNNYNQCGIALMATVPTF